jgi:hypothetical protein
VGVILIVIGIIGVVALGAFANRFVEDMGFNPDGTFDTCEFISPDEVAAILGDDAVAMPMGGLVDGTIGQLLDKRILGDAPDCWIVSDEASSVTGRLARQDGNASATFAAARQQAEEAGYYAGDTSAGDEAFCTGMSEVGSFGALVRRGDSVVYVGLIDANAMQSGDFEVSEDGVFTSDPTCALAAELAEAALP